MSENNPLNCRIVFDDEVAKLRAENTELKECLNQKITNQAYLQQSLTANAVALFKLRAENAELKMPISPDELLPMALMNARLIDENNELKSHNDYLQGDAGLADMVIERLKAENTELRKLVRKSHDNGFVSAVEDNDEFVSWWKWSAQNPILKEQP